MNLLKSPKLLLPFFLVLILQTACTKDSDLLAEYVIEDSITAEQQNSQNSNSDTSNDETGNEENNSNPDPQPGNRNVEPGFFVTTTGNANNDGLTEETAWNIEHAFAIAQPGDVVYVKAGVYQDINLYTSRSGSPGNPIKFIGYKDAPGDVLSTIFSTYTKGDFDADNSILRGSEMPLLNNDRGRNNAPAESDRGINIDHSYIHIENFQVQYYQYGVDVDVATEGVSMINIVANEMGNWDPTNPGWNTSFSNPPPSGNLSGIGFRIQFSSNAIVKNCISFNAGHVNFDFIDSSNLRIENTRAYATKPGNSSDYNMVLFTVSNSVVSNYESYRVSGLPHANRAIELKCDSDDNLIEDLYAENLRCVIQLYCDRNVFRNVEMQGSGNPFEAEFSIASECNDNVVYNLKSNNSGGINFRAGDTFCGGEAFPNSSTGDNNYFINPIITNVIGWHQAAIDFGFQFGNGSAGTNYIIGGTFENAPYLVKVDRPNDMLYLINCTFSNITQGYAGSRENEGFVPKFTFDHVNFHNVAFGLPAESDVTNFNPGFNSDYTLGSSSPLRDRGINAASKYGIDASTDFTGNTRGNGSGWDIGAFEN